MQVNPVLSYKDNLDSKIKEIISFKPNLFLNSNETTVSMSIIQKLLESGFKGVFIDAGSGADDSWGCGRTIVKYQRAVLKNNKNKAIGYSSSQNACYKDYHEDEKEFRKEVLDKDEYYYTYIGLFYKMTKHILESILKSKLPVNRKNVHKIIKANSFFRGFSGNRFNLYKTKDSPEFLHIYKHHFQKDFYFENVTKDYMTQKNETLYPINKTKQKD